MESNNAHNLTHITSKIPVSIFARVANLVQSILSPAQHRKTAIKSDVQTRDAGIQFNHHETIINLLNQGKHYDEAAQIAQVAHDWQIDLTTLDSSHIAVQGKSVWIDLDN